jgi:competence protein ComEC
MSLDVYVFGDSWGESILLHIPDKYAVLIDCFDYSTKSKIRELVNFLGITKLDLLVVTHPHLDHFKDIHVVASELSPSKVCTWGYDNIKILNFQISKIGLIFN